MAEWDGLENRYTRKGIEGSNPSLSASPNLIVYVFRQVTSNEQPVILNKGNHQYLYSKRNDSIGSNLEAL